MTESEQGRTIAEQREFNRQMLSAIERRDVEDMMALIWPGPDVIFVGPRGETARGYDEIRPIEEAFLGSFDWARLHIEEEDYTIHEGTVVAVLGIVATLGVGGEEHQTRIRLTDVRVRRDGRWVVIYNHSHPLDSPTR